MSSPTVELLKRAKLRSTTPRRAVLEALEGPGRHLDAESVVRSVRSRQPSVSRQAVYDNLNALAAAGIVRRIELPGSPSLYELRTGDNHHHLVCRRCRRTVDIDCAHGAAPCLQPSVTHGFVIDEAEVVYWGTCPDCRAPAPEPSQSHVQ